MNANELNIHIIAYKPLYVNITQEKLRYSPFTILMRFYRRSLIAWIYINLLYYVKDVRYSYFMWLYLNIVIDMNNSI